MKNSDRYDIIMKRIDRCDKPDVFFKSKDGVLFALHSPMLKLRWPMFRKNRDDAVNRISSYVASEVTAVIEHLYAGSPVQENMKGVLRFLEIPFPEGDTLGAYKKAMLELFTKKEGSDFVIECMGQRFHVHKFILAIRSEFFASMLQAELEEVQSGVLKDIYAPKAELMSAFLQYLYTGDAEFKSHEDAVPFLKLCQDYGVHAGHDGELEEFVASKVLLGFHANLTAIKSSASTAGFSGLVDLIESCEV